jgi:hypothetical protein
VYRSNTLIQLDLITKSVCSMVGPGSTGMNAYSRG